MDSDVVEATLKTALRIIVTFTCVWMILSSTRGQSGIFHYVLVRNELRRLNHDIHNLRAEYAYLTEALEDLQSRKDYVFFKLFQEYGLTQNGSCYLSLKETQERIEF